MPKPVLNWTGMVADLAAYKFNVKVFGIEYTNCKFHGVDQTGLMLSFTSGNNKTMCVPLLQCSIMVTEHIGNEKSVDIEDIVTSDTGSSKRPKSRRVVDEVDEEDDDFEDDFEDEPVSKKKKPVKKPADKKRKAKR